MAKGKGKSNPNNETDNADPPPIIGGEGADEVNKGGADGGGGQETNPPEPSEPDPKQSAQRPPLSWDDLPAERTGLLPRDACNRTVDGRPCRSYQTRAVRSSRTALPDGRTLVVYERFCKNCNAIYKVSQTVGTARRPDVDI